MNIVKTCTAYWQQYSKYRGKKLHNNSRKLNFIFYQFKCRLQYISVCIFGMYPDPQNVMSQNIADATFYNSKLILGFFSASFPRHSFQYSSFRIQRAGAFGELLHSASW